MSDPFFAANEMECYIGSSVNAVEVATAGAYDPAYCRGAIKPGLASITEYAESQVYTAATTSWTHWEWYQVAATGNSGATMMSWYNSVGTAVFRLQFTALLTLQAQYWNGSAWANIGTTLVLSLSVRYIFDLKIICGGSGSFELFSGGNATPVLSGSAAMTSVTNIARHRLQNSTTAAAATSQSHFSQIICADVSTLGWKYATKPPTGNGANTAFTGVFGDVDELVTADADYIESITANDVETYTGAAMTLASGAVKAVVVSARALNIATGPQNLQLALRRGASNYFSANVAGIGTGFGPFLGIWGTDPSTAAAWTPANAALAANEFGVKSIT